MTGLARLMGPLPIFVLAAAVAAHAQRKAGDYALGPDSLAQEGVPKGKLEGPFLFKSQIIADTVGKYWVYVPAQGAHSDAHGGSLLPDILRWIWGGSPK